MPLMGISVSFGTLVCVQTLMKLRMGSNSKIASQDGVGGGTMGLPLEVASMA